MRCIEDPLITVTCRVGLLLLLSACAAPAERAPAAVPTVASTAVSAAAPAASAPVAVAEQARHPAEASKRPAPPGIAPPRYLKLPPPGAVASMDEVKVLAAMRMVAAHPDTSYPGRPPEPLLAIPVLEIELHADGSVRDIKVIREPRQARHTIQLAIDIVRRAAPYGDVSRLKKPWKFVEVFLFDDELRFKPAVLDQ